MERLSGRNVVGEALRGRRQAKLLWVAEEQARSGPVARIVEEAGRKPVPVKRVTRQRLTQLWGNSDHQGLVLEVEPYPYVGLPLLIEESLRATSSTIILLDGITDPMNLGAIVRSAVAFGVSGIILGKARSAHVTPTVVRASAGSSEHVMICRWNLLQAIGELKKSSFWVAGTSASEGVSLWKADLGPHVAFVLGSEGTGMSAGVEKACDLLINVPIDPRVQSLNVSATAAVVLAERARKLAQSGKSGE